MQSQPFAWRLWKMLKWRNKVPIYIKPEFCIILALTLLILPVKWIFAWILASAFHELCHYIALKLSGCKVLRVQINLNGVIIETDLLSCTAEILCALAGPLGGLSLLLIAKWLPRVAICGCFQSLYNLIPIFPLDGGRAVACVLKRIFPGTQGEHINAIWDRCILLAFVFGGVYAAVFLKLGVIPLLFAAILVLRNKIVKTSCKQRLLRVK